MLLYKLLNKYADVAELVDALVLGTSAYGVGVQVLSSAPKDNIVAPDEKTIKSTVKGRFFLCLSIEIFLNVSDLLLK